MFPDTKSPLGENHTAWKSSRGLFKTTATGISHSSPADPSLLSPVLVQTHQLNVELSEEEAAL